MKKLLLILALILLGVVGAYAVYEKKTAAPSEQKPPISSGDTDDTVCPAIAAAGRYTNYSEDILQKKCSGYSKTILFFYAPWCPECRGFDKAITASEVPAGTQILKVDYDSSTELKKKYGVTIQTTFVSIGSRGEKIKLWTGYGAEKSLDLVLENT